MMRLERARSVAWRKEGLTGFVGRPYMKVGDINRKTSGVPGGFGRLLRHFFWTFAQWKSGPPRLALHNLRTTGLASPFSALRAVAGWNVAKHNKCI